MKRVSKNLTKAVTLSVLLMLPYGMVHAQDFTETIQGKNDKYADEGIRTGDETKGFVYNFKDGDNLNITKADTKLYLYAGINKSFNAEGVNGDFTINGKLNINVTQDAANLNSNQGYGIYSNGTTTGDVIMNDGAVITVKMEQGSDTGNLSAWGISNGADIDVILGSSYVDVSTVNEKKGAGATGLAVMGSGEINYKNGTIKTTAQGLNYANAGGINISYMESGSIHVGNVEIITDAKNIGSEGAGESFGIINSGNGGVVTGGNVNINASATSRAKYDGEYTSAYGILAEMNNNKIELESAEITATATNTADQDVLAFGIRNSGNNEVTINGTTKITATGNAAGEWAYTEVYGICSNGGTTTVGDGFIEATLTNTAKDSGNFVYGIFANGGTVTLGKMTINAKAVGGDDVVNVTGIRASGEVGNKSVINMAGGYVNVSAENYNENADGDVMAVLADNGGTVNINKDSSNDVMIFGDIQADADSAIILNLNTKNSVLNGAVQDLLVSEGGTGNGMKMTVANGAKWNPDNASDVSNLTVSDGGVVDTALMYSETSLYKFKNLKVTNLDGEGGIFKINVDGSKNEYNSTKLFIEGTHSGSHIIDINEIGDDMDNAKGTVLVSVKDEQGSFSAKDKEGSLYWTKYVLAKETENVTDGYSVDWVLDDIRQDTSRGTTTVDTIVGANALNYQTWRAENDQLMRRMGELRINGNNEQGAWFRVHGAEISQNDSAGFENKYTTYELGYDQVTKKTADMTRYTGAALSYTDGSSSYESGSGENHSKALSFYNTDIYDSGHYLDLVFKFANMDNDFSVYDTQGQNITGEYKNNGISLSAEYGRKNILSNGWYVEPQAQLTLGYFGGDEYDTSNGISVDQSGIASVLGRIGFNIGREIGDNGVIYAKANLLHEFAGDYDIYMSDNAGNHRTESASFNDTWVEYGVGAALKTGKNNHLYFDFVKTTGGDFEKDWQWNAGMRWTF